jgi:hypothetical protein
MRHLLPQARQRGVRAATAAAIGAVALAMTASAASADGQLRWTFENAYASGCSATGLHCTWLGYMTNPTPGSGTRGSVSATAPALGSTVTPASPRGANVFNTFAFPLDDAASSATTYTGAAQSLEFDGTIAFVSPLPPSGHGITMTVQDPRIELAGNGTGALFASGVKAAGVGSTAPYDRTKPVFDLDLANVVVSTAYDGTQTVEGIVPSIDETDYAFPANYVTGAGPDRTPNTFGGFTLVLDRPESAGGAVGPAGPAGPAGLAGPAGAVGPTGPAGTTTIERIQIVTLAAAPFGKGSRKVRVLKRGKLMARGTVKGSALRVTLTERAGKRLAGRLVLRVAGGKRRAVVRLG